MMNTKNIYCFYCCANVPKCEFDEHCQSGTHRILKELTKLRRDIEELKKNKVCECCKDNKQMSAEEIKADVLFLAKQFIYEEEQEEKHEEEQEEKHEEEQEEKHEPIKKVIVEAELFEETENNKKLYCLCCKSTFNKRQIKRHQQTKKHIKSFERYNRTPEEEAAAKERQKKHIEDSYKKEHVKCLFSEEDEEEKKEIEEQDDIEEEKEEQYDIEEDEEKEIEEQYEQDDIEEEEKKEEENIKIRSFEPFMTPQDILNRRNGKTAKELCAEYKQKEKQKEKDFDEYVKNLKKQDKERARKEKEHAINECANDICYSWLRYRTNKTDRNLKILNDEIEEHRNEGYKIKIKDIEFGFRLYINEKKFNIDYEYFYDDDE